MRPITQPLAADFADTDGLLSERRSVQLYPLPYSCSDPCHICSLTQPFSAIPFSNLSSPFMLQTFQSLIAYSLPFVSVTDYSVVTMHLHCIWVPLATLIIFGCLWPLSYGFPLTRRALAEVEVDKSDDSYTRMVNERVLKLMTRKWQHRHRKRLNSIREALVSSYILSFCTVYACTFCAKYNSVWNDRFLWICARSWGIRGVLTEKNWPFCYA